MGEGEAMSEELTPEQMMVMATRLSASIKPMFAGLPAPVTGVALADLLAMWVASHIVMDNPNATRKLRDQVIKDHIAAMRPLIKVNEDMLLTRMKRPN